MHRGAAGFFVEPERYGRKNKTTIERWLSASRIVMRHCLVARFNQIEG